MHIVCLRYFVHLNEIKFVAFLHRIDRKVCHYISHVRALNLSLFFKQLNLIVVSFNMNVLLLLVSYFHDLYFLRIFFTITYIVTYDTKLCTFDKLRLLFFVFTMEDYDSELTVTVSFFLQLRASDVVE